MKNLREIEKRDFSKILIFILASNNTSKEIIIIKTKTKPSVILTKSSEIDNCEICGHACGIKRNTCDVMNKVQ